ncbi:MAG: enoyl-CoA hydratase-related protein [Pseudomonadota bacterium]|nr:enoyl-CoA hydratase-related protein [Pseudomonadota bacterium]
MTSTYPDYETLQVTVAGGVAEVTMNRPDKGNALNLQLAVDLLDAADRVSEDAAVRAVLLTGAGKSFCFGGDLASFHAEGASMARHLKDVTVPLHAAISRLTRMDPPLIVAVNGTAAGAGFSLALIGDLVLSAASAKYTMAYTRIGVSPDGSSTYFLPRVVGLRRAQELMFTNRLLSAEEAAEWGVVTRVVADEALMDEALALAAEMAAGPTRAYGQIKTLLASTFGATLETQMEFESLSIAGMAKTADGRNGIAAFLEKRKVTFTGD